MANPLSNAYQAAAKAVQHHWQAVPAFVREGGSFRVTPKLSQTLGVPALHLPCGQVGVSTLDTCNGGLRACLLDSLCFDLVGLVQGSDGAHLQNERLRALNLFRALEV